MKQNSEVYDSPEQHITKSPEKTLGTFDDLRTSDKAGLKTFDDIRGQNPEGIKTFDDLRQETERSSIGAGSSISESERLSHSSTKLSIDEGRHRTYVAAKEGYDNVPVKLNDIYTKKDGKGIIDRRGVTHVSFDKDALNSEDMQNLMKEHDFQQWELGQAEHKGLTYNDHVKEFGRLQECQEMISNGHSPDEIEGLLGKEHADTYKRFYETKPITIDRTIEMDA